MKAVTLSKVGIPIVCDFYLCPHLATEQFATPDSPPGQCFRVCPEHKEGMMHVLGLSPSVEAVEKPVEAKKTPAKKTAFTEV